MDTREQRSRELLELLRQKFGSKLIRAEVNLGDAEIEVARENMGEVLRLLKLDADLKFHFFVNVTAVDYLDSKPNRFELVYHLMSVPGFRRLRMKVGVPEGTPEVETATLLWPGANFMEREVWDMFGIRFRGHPDMRRILMYDEFQGHPLRKDYPVQGKQPRIPLRAPEVHNTARDMQRAALVRIRSRAEREGGASARS